MKPTETQFSEDLHAWKARLAEWVGLDHAELTNIGWRADGPHVRIEWTSTGAVRPQASRGVDPGDYKFCHDGGDAAPMWQASVIILADEVEEMVAAVGHPPEQFTTAQKAALWDAFGRHGDRPTNQETT